ncbi:MAG: DUF4838 domain-containing protein [Ruminococcaceae bacterium]|nr:DUF4838 domain-containing protein [Oscillospiraceae bacterium]
MKITLIADKKTEYVIVIPASPAPVEETAAAELQGYLKKALDAELCVKKEGEAVGKAFYIGHTEYAKAAGVCGKSKENWIMKMVDGNLILTGGEKTNDRGIIYAVYHFLEDIVGVRWWNYWEEDVLKLSELSLEDDFYKEGTPTFYYRKPIHYGAFKDFYFDARTRTNVVGDDGLEGGVYHPSIKKLGGAMPMGRPHHVHTLGQYFPPEETFSEHPDWFAWSAFQNKRVSYGHYCLTNEEFIEALTEKVMAYIEEDQRLAKETGVELPDFYSVSFPDSVEGFCQCEACKKAVEKSGASGYAINFVNKIAKRVAEKYPDVKIETLVYSVYLDKPLDDTLPEKNVIIRLAQVYVDIIHGIHDKGNRWYLQLLQDWSAICKKAGCTLYIWDYMYNLFFDLPAPVPNRLVDTYRAFCEYGVKGVFVENECLTADMWELTHYMLTHLGEDPHQDADALVCDFMTRFYGPAAPYMQEYYDCLVRASKENDYSVFCIIESVHFNYLDAKTVKRGMELLEKAMDAVRGDAVFGPRVQYSQAILGGTLLIKYHDLKKNAALCGITFDYDIEAVRKMVIAGYKDAAKLPRIGENNGRIGDAIRYYESMSLGEEEKPALPAELSGVNSDDVYQFLFKNMCRHGSHSAKLYGFSVAEDADSSTGKAAKFCFDDAAFKHEIIALSVTGKQIENSHPISISIEQDAKQLCGIELYKEDVVPNEYHLYKVGSVSGIRESGDTRVDIFGINFEWLSLTGISVAFPMDACDVYLSMKFTGEMYGGSKDDQEAVFLDRAIVVRK